MQKLPITNTNTNTNLYEATTNNIKASTIGGVSVA